MNKSLLYQAIFLLCFALTPAPSEASSDYSSNAVRDGIGYRSNLLDPDNPYAVPMQYTFTTLLSRYWVKHEAPSSPSVDEVTPDMYYAALNDILSDPALIDTLEPLPEDLYGYGSCASNNLAVMLEFMMGAAENIEDRFVVDFLVQARHEILFICHMPDTDQAGFQAYIEEQLQTLNDVKEAEPWVNYLRGIMSFYIEDFDQARRYFATIPDTAAPWLAQTARYLDVRIAKIQVDALAYDCYQCGASEQSPQFIKAIADFKASIENHIRSYSDGFYDRSVSGLRRYVLRLQDKPLQLNKVYEAAFVKAFGANSDVPREAKDSLLHEMDLFYLNGPAVAKTSRVHPFLLTYEVLMRKHNLRQRQTVRQISTMRTDFDSMKSAYAHYLGLAAYTELMFLSAEGNDVKVAATQIDQKEYGPLWLDARVLQARALGRIGQHEKSAKAWLELDTVIPTFNAQTEMASQYLLAHKFDEFARLTQARLTQAHLTEARLKTKPTGSGAGIDGEDYRYSNEFSRSVEDFNKTFEPALTLLRQGYSSFASADEMQRTLDDPNISDQIKFMAAEPALRRFLLHEDYAGYLQLFGSLTDNLPKGEDADLAHAYQKVTPAAQRLSSNKNDADALVDLGYFLYAKHIFSACEEESVTLWELTLGACGDDDKRVLDGVVPIDLFDRALSLYKQRDTRQPGEAKVLRMMILCFKSNRNQANCVRNRKEAYPKKTRTALFNQLHQRFPTEAKQTPYWY
ncbi:MAG: hypothetical protein JKY92_06820 [Magnetovibrio sp.]|nr:hypothetical protein [Magnetovibrio sp.]